MGTHVSSPSRVATSGDLLSDYLKKKQDIGAQIANRSSVSDGALPFLFKVLSIEKALSIQTHPDRATAEKLHAEQPRIYRGAHGRMVPALLAHAAYRWEPQAGDGDRFDAVFISLRIPSYRSYRIISGGGSGVCGFGSGCDPASVHRLCILSSYLLPGDKGGVKGVVYITHDRRGRAIRSSVGDAG